MKNKRIFFIAMVISLLMISENSHLRAQKFEKGDMNFDFTVGFPTPLWRGGYKMQIPLIGLSGDYGIVNSLGPGVIGVGAFIGVATYKDDYFNQNRGYKYTVIPITLRGTYHYQFFKKFDTYAGVLLGMRIESGRWFGDESPFYANRVRDFRPVCGIFAGAKYYITPMFAVLAEFNIGAALINIGAGIKF